jgi:hypothetical protein
VPALLSLIRLPNDDDTLHFCTSPLIAATVVTSRGYSAAPSLQRNRDDERLGCQCGAFGSKKIVHRLPRGIFSRNCFTRLAHTLSQAAAKWSGYQSLYYASVFQQQRKTIPTMQLQSYRRQARFLICSSAGTSHSICLAHRRLTKRTRCSVPSPRLKITVLSTTRTRISYECTGPTTLLISKIEAQRPPVILAEQSFGCSRMAAGEVSLVAITDQLRLSCATCRWLIFLMP